VLFLALSIAEQYVSQFPRDSVSVTRDFYVDDMFTETNTIDELKLIRDKVTPLLKLGIE